MSEKMNEKTSELPYDFSTFAVHVDGQWSHVGLAEIFPPQGEPTKPRMKPAPDTYDAHGAPVYDRPGPRPLFTI